MTYKRDMVEIGDKVFLDNFNPDTNSIHWIEVTRNMYMQLQRVAVQNDVKPNVAHLINSVPCFNGIQVKWNDLIPSDNLMIIQYEECESKQEKMKKVIKFLEKYPLK